MCCGPSFFQCALSQLSSLTGSLSHAEMAQPQLGHYFSIFSAACQPIVIKSVTDLLTTRADVQFFHSCELSHPNLSLLRTT